MIPRILTSQHAQEIIQGFLWGFLALYNGSMYILGIISEADWNRVTGPHAFLFGLLIAVGVLWNTGRTREKNEAKRQKDAAETAAEERLRDEEARDRRHKESLEAQERHAEKLLNLTSTTIKAIATNTEAVNRMNTAIMTGHNQVSDRLDRIEGKLK